MICGMIMHGYAKETVAMFPLDFPLPPCVTLVTCTMTINIPCIFTVHSFLFGLILHVRWFPSGCSWFDRLFMVWQNVKCHWIYVVCFTWSFHTKLLSETDCLHCFYLRIFSFQRSWIHVVNNGIHVSVHGTILFYTHTAVQSWHNAGSDHIVYSEVAQLLQGGAVPTGYTAAPVKQSHM